MGDDDDSMCVLEVIFQGKQTILALRLNGDAD